jgi:hypothetical protein
VRLPAVLPLHPEDRGQPREDDAHAAVRQGRHDGAWVPRPHAAGDGHLAPGDIGGGGGEMRMQGLAWWCDMKCIQNGRRPPQKGNAMQCRSATRRCLPAGKNHASSCCEPANALGGGSQTVAQPIRCVRVLHPALCLHSPSPPSPRTWRCVYRQRPTLFIARECTGANGSSGSQIFSSPH